MSFAIGASAYSGGEMGPCGIASPAAPRLRTSLTLSVVRRRGIVHGELARTQRDWRRALAAAADGPAAADWLPVVFIIGQAVQPGSDLMLPVPLELVDQLGVPVNVHARTIDVVCRVGLVALIYVLASVRVRFPASGRNAALAVP